MVYPTCQDSHKVKKRNTTRVKRSPGGGPISLITDLSMRICMYYTGILPGNIGTEK